MNGNRSGCQDILTDNKEGGFGSFTKDEMGMPCYDLAACSSAAVDYPFKHLISTGRISALADKWGNINIFTTEGGWLDLASTKGRCRSGLYGIIEIKGELISCIHGELEQVGSIRYGTGYARYTGNITGDKVDLLVEQEFLTPPERESALIACFTLENFAPEQIDLTLFLRSDVFPSGKPLDLNTDNGEFYVKFTHSSDDIGEFFLISSESFFGTIADNSLELRKDVTLEPGERKTFSCCVGYGKDVYVKDIQDYIIGNTPSLVKRKWKEQTSVLKLEPPEEWMKDECIWSYGQLLSFVSYDSSLGEYYLNLGGYGWSKFGVREDCETALVLAPWDKELAKSSLRWVAGTQLFNGDIPKQHDFKREKSFSGEFESDNEIWFILGCGEYLKETGDTDFLGESVPYRDGKGERMWDHLKWAWYWIVNSIGKGSHGLILIRDGDWNDYLSRMGSRGQGESVMNSAMACRAFDLLAEMSLVCGDNMFHEEVIESVNILRTAVSASFDEKWFIRGYTDDGEAVGSYAEDRLFINAQSWAVLGKCGTPEQQRQGLLSAVEKCHTHIGMVLMNRPYSSPPPNKISWAPIPAGEGENSGIWPQTVYWMVWALAEAGLTDLALEEWAAMSLRNHARCFPQVPYGIFNGPDCYSSHFAGLREGYTQLQLIDRGAFTPMNPMVAWQAFAMRKILKVDTENFRGKF